MNKNGPIIIIEDDVDDIEILRQIFKSLSYPNELIFLVDGAEAFQFLTTSTVKPFLLISDINIPKINGLELRDKIQSHEDLKLRYTPYIFFSTSATPKTITDVYSKCVQGFFIKPVNIDQLERSIKIIVDYWAVCTTPGDIEK